MNVALKRSSARGTSVLLASWHRTLRRVPAPYIAPMSRTQAMLALLVAGGLGVVLLAVLGGVLVQRGLRPLEELATVAEGITARRLDQRMALRGCALRPAR
jgi:hypothetical protein